MHQICCGILWIVLEWRWNMFSFQVIVFALIKETTKEILKVFSFEVIVLIWSKEKLQS